MLLERALGGAVTLLLAGVGFLLAIGRYSIGAYLWPEAIFVVGTITAGVVFFSRTVRRRLSFALPLARKLRLETPARAVYDGIHGYREHPGTLLVVAAVTVLLQLSRILAIYASGRAVGIHLSALPYIVLGPLLFLVMLVPFTVNGLGVREAFFVSFMGNLGVPADRGVRLRLPLLRDDDPARGTRARGHPLGERLRPARAGPRTQWLTSRSSSSPGTRCRGSSNVSSPCADET